jgi:hypothetical protein
MNMQKKYDKVEESLNPIGKTLYLNKVFGKMVLSGLWIVLLIANLICLVRMRYQNFRDWCILSVSGYFAILFIIDPLLYLILANIMLKP